MKIRKTKGHSKILIGILALMMVLNSTSFSVFAMDDTSDDSAATNSDSAASDVITDEKQTSVESTGTSSETEEKADLETSSKTTGNITTYTAKIDGYEVIVTTEDGTFDEEVTLDVRQVVEDIDKAGNEETSVEADKEFKEYFEESQNASMDYVIDIRFLNKDGEEVEPSKEVEVQILADYEPTDNATYILSSSVVHFIENENGEIVDSEVVAESGEETIGTVEIDNEENQIAAEFTTDSFSYYYVYSNATVVHFVVANVDSTGYITGVNDDLIKRTVIPDWDSTEVFGDNRWQGTFEFNNQKYVGHNGNTNNFQIPSGLEYVKTVMVNSNASNIAWPTDNEINNSFEIDKITWSDENGWSWKYIEDASAGNKEEVNGRQVYAIYQIKGTSSQFHFVEDETGVDISGVSMTDVVSNWIDNSGGIFDFDAQTYSTLDGSSADFKEITDYEFKGAYLLDANGNRIDITQLKFDTSDSTWKYLESDSSEWTTISNMSNYNVYFEYSDDTTRTLEDPNTYITLADGTQIPVYYVTKDGKSISNVDVSDEVKALSEAATSDGVSADLFSTSISGYKSTAAYVVHDGQEYSTDTVESIGTLITSIIDGKNNDGSKIYNWAYYVDGHTEKFESEDAIYVVYTKDTRDLHQVDTVDNTSLGIQLYMFDYSSQPYTFKIKDSDIKEYNLDTTYKPWGSTIQGLYSQTLDADGYPTLVNNSFTDGLKDGNGFEGSELSLSEFMSLSTTNSLVNSKVQANHLFLQSIYDETGHFYYNSAENSAELNTNSGNFTVYEELSSPKNQTYFFMNRGNFMPYNRINTDSSVSETTNKYDEVGNLLSTDYRPENADITGNTRNYQGATVYKYSNTTDYYFGMYGTMNFYQPEDGRIDKKNSTDGEKEDMIFQFTGDDDMVVYIDGVLVLDLGGIHDAQSGTINFNTGVVTYTTTKVNGTNADGSQDVTVTEHTTTIKEMFAAAGKVDSVEWNGNTLADNTYHSLSFFYMERGGGASNLKLDLNIPPAPTGKFTVDKNVNWLDTTSADKDQTFKMQLSYVTYEDEDNDGIYEKETLEAIPAGTTYTIKGDSNTYQVEKDGYIYLKDGQEAVFENIEPGVIVRVTEELTNSQLNTFAADYRSVSSDGIDGIWVMIGFAEEEITAGKTSKLRVINNEVLEDKGRLVIEKISDDDDSTRLKGAVFDLYIEDDDAETIIPYTDGVKGKLIEAGLKTESDGTIVVNNLDFRTYYVVETEAPDGFDKLEEAIKVEVTKDGITSGQSEKYSVLTDAKNIVDRATEYTIGGSYDPAKYTLNGSTMTDSAWTVCINGHRKTPSSSGTSSYTKISNVDYTMMKKFIDEPLNLGREFTSDDFQAIKRALYWYLTNTTYTNSEKYTALQNVIRVYSDNVTSASTSETASIKACYEASISKTLDDTIDSELIVNLYTRDEVVNGNYSQIYQNMISAELRKNSSSAGTVLQVINEVSDDRESLPSAGGIGIALLFIIAVIALFISNVVMKDKKSAKTVK